MSAPIEPVAAEKPPVRRRGRQALLVAGVVVGVLLVLTALLYLNRRAAARQILVGWLAQQGIVADTRIERVEIDGLVASIRIGDPASPDVVVDRVEVDYAIAAPWSKAGLGLTPSRIRLLRPVVRARFQNGQLSFGSLDPLIERFTGRPPGPDSRGPFVLVEKARVRIETDFGPATILGDARVDDSRLLRLTARMPATAFRRGETRAEAVQAAIDLTTAGDRVAIRLDAAAGRARQPGFDGEGARLSLTADLPYPDFKVRRVDGEARIDLHLVADRLAAADAMARQADLRLTFDGRAQGWLDSFDLDGAGTADVRAARIEGAGASAATSRLQMGETRIVATRTPESLAWRLDGAATMTAARASGAGLDGAGLTVTARRLAVGGRGAAVEAEGTIGLAAHRLAWSDLVLGGVRGETAIDLVSDAGVRLNARGAVRAARGAWPLFGPPSGDDVPELAEMKRALSAFALDAPGFELASGDSGARLTLTRPATVRPANGGVLTLAPVATPVFSAPRGQAGGGALSLTATRGRGLPDAAFNIPAWRLTPSGFTATLDGRAALDFGLARGIDLQTRGALTSSNGRLTYVAVGCIPLTVDRLDLDENDVVDISGDLCPVAAPLVSVADGRWRAEGALRGLDASAPFLALQVRDADGRFTATGGPAGLGLEADIARATVEDATTPLRFNPLTASGTARLRDETWTGAFDLARDGTTLGQMSLAHDGVAGAGGLTISAPSIVFAEGGLQPSDLSPLAEVIGSPATGSVAFEGRIDWRADAEGTSAGRLTIPGLDFTSPAGPVKGLRGTVDFISLAPLTAAPGQRLTADLLESVAPLTDIEVTFGLDEAAVTVEGGDLAVAGGHIRVEPFAVSLEPDQPISGVIVLENVQLGQVIAGAGFGDKVNLDAVVSGRLPFTFDRVNGVRVTGGTLAAVQPGRLSIAREALSGLEAGGGGEAVPPNTVQDLAYQAMENLSFDILSAEVNSLDEGRIGVLFHIRGRHDPPQRQELRIPLAEFISREFLNRPLDLPSGTGIDLTLDTTLNLNQLVSDLLELNRARGGQPSSRPSETASPPLP
jgi:hypothetical protein